MALRLDEAAVGRMLATLLESAAGGAGVTIVHFGEPVPENAADAVFARPASIELERVPRRGPEDTDKAHGAYEVVMAVPERQASGHALLTALAQVGAALEFKTVSELSGPAATGHVLHTLQVGVSRALALEDEHERLVFGSLTLRFEVERRAGTSLEDHIA